VSITFDFKERELRKTWKESNSERKEKFQLGSDFNVVYRDIERLSAFGRVRHLHFLAHSGDDGVFYQPNLSTSAKDVKRLGPQFTAAFEPDSVVKIHGCLHNANFIAKVRDFCQGKMTAIDAIDLLG